MNASLDLPHLIEKIYELDQWLREFPMTQEYRNKTTFRQFHEILDAKQVELGLTPEVRAELNQIDGNVELDQAWLEVGMTVDSREMLCPGYFVDLPMNYYWMPEYEPALSAVEDFVNQQPIGQGIPDEAILEAVRKYLPDGK